MPTMISVRTSDGGRTSSYRSALRSRASWQSAAGDRGAQAAVGDEHRPGQLHPPLEVEDAEGLARLPVGHPLVLGVAVGVRTALAQDRVVVLARAVGGVGRRQVGDEEEDLRGLLGPRRRPRRPGPPPARRGPGSRPGALRPASVSPAFAEAADLLRQGLDLVADLVPLLGQVPLPAVQLDDPVDRREVLAPAPEGGLDRIGVAADQPDVDHRREGTAAHPSNPGLSACVRPGASR